jgi:hypothetical protein
MFNAPIAMRALNRAPDSDDSDDSVERLKVQPG